MLPPPAPDGSIASAPAGAPCSGVGSWKPFISSAIINTGEFPLGFNFESYEFRVLEWGFGSDFVIALDKMMINIPGRDLNQVAKEYSEKLQREKQEQLEQD